MVTNFLFSKVGAQFLCTKYEDDGARSRLPWLALACLTFNSMYRFLVLFSPRRLKAIYQHARFGQQMVDLNTNLTAVT